MKAAGAGDAPIAGPASDGAGGVGGGVGGTSPRAGPRRWWTPWAKLALTALAVWAIVEAAGPRLAEAWQLDWNLVRPDPPFIVMAVLLATSTFAIQSWVWSGALAALGEPRVPLLRGAAILLIANLGRYLPGKVAQLLGLAALARRDGMSGVRSVAAGLVVQMLHLTAGVMIGGWVLVDAVPLEGAGRTLAVAACVAAAAGMTAALYFGGVGALTGWLLRRLGHAEAEIPPGSGGRIVRWLPGHLLHWLVHGAAFYCLARGLGMSVTPWQATTTFAAAYLVGYAAFFAPMGIGVREVSLAVLLAPLAGPAAAAMLAAMQRVWITAAELGCALPAAFLLRRARGAAAIEARP